MRALICGSRGWRDPAPIARLLDDLLAEHGADLTLIHGGCPKGADAIAHAEAAKRGIRTIVETARWNRFGGAAGPIRNQAMIDLHHPDAVFAFRSSGKSRGTDDMVNRARRASVPTRIFTDPGEPTRRAGYTD